MERPRLNEVSDGIPLEQGEHHVHQRTDAVEHEHAHKGFFVGGQQGKQPLPDLDVKGFGIFLLVKCSH